MDYVKTTYVFTETKDTLSKCSKKSLRPDFGGWREAR